MAGKVKGFLMLVIPLAVFLGGFGLIAYPTVSDWLNSGAQDRAILSYSETVTGLTDEEYDYYYQQAVDYNALASSRGNPYLTTEEEQARYETLLNVDGSGIMGYIHIPLIGCTLPIYHGTEEETLQTAVGHLEWTSLPVGGLGTHCVLSGHRGLPGARLFTDIDRLSIGDRFSLYVLDEELDYEVDQILVVLPDETDALRATPGEDYCTLVTCTPYGINTHRILARGHRIAAPEAEEARAMRVTADGSQMNSVYLGPVAALPVVLAAGNLAAWLRKMGIRRKRAASMEAGLDERIAALYRDWKAEGCPGVGRGGR